MNKTQALPLRSPELVELRAIFYELEQPYGLKEIIHFNQAYERIYRNLRQEEKRDAEVYVDALIEGLETPRLASKIFGVV